jgi:hypothetical protein
VVRADSQATPVVASPLASHQRLWYTFFISSADAEFFNHAFVRSVQFHMSLQLLLRHIDATRHPPRGRSP